MQSRSHLIPAGCLLAWCVAFVWSAIDPHHPEDWWLENLLVFISVPLVLWGYRRHRLSNHAYLLGTLFLILHAVGAHHTYSEVPLGDWARDQWNWSRNHYDRLVHFSFGLLLAAPIRELLMRWAGVRGFWSYYLAFDAACALSALYEIVEWLAAQLTAPELGAAYLGIQGDQWDAQKDMGLALLGALLALLITAWLARGPSASERSSC